jgi:hypothetical protein
LEEVVASREVSMTPDDFRVIAERLPTVQARCVLETIQFKSVGKTFATLGWPENGWAVVKLSGADQVRLLRQSQALGLEPGRRRRSGVTLVRLAALDADTAADLLSAAWREAQGAPARVADRTVGPRLSA